MTPVERRSLQTAMAALAQGDRAAFDRVFLLLWPALRAVSGRMLGGGQDADDAAQQALCKLLGQAWRFDANRPALPWALTFVINECRTIRNRERRRHVTPVAEVATACDGSTPEAELIERDLIHALQAAVGELSVAERQALGLAPAASSPSAPTVRKRRQRALSRLRIVWRKLYGPV